MCPNSTTEREISNWKNIISKLVKHEDLTFNEARSSMGMIFNYLNDDLKDVDVILSAYFFGLTSKGLTMEELSGIATAMNESKKIKFSYESDKPIVTGGGTGGDSIPTINVTTPAILIAAAADALAVKSGAKAFSSRTGAIDLALAMGINVYANSRIIEKCLKQVGTAVWASSVAYPWMKSLIEFRNHPSFGALLPIFESLRLVIASSLNPFSVKRQIRGTAVMNPELIAQALHRTGHDKALVPIGYGPTDDVRIDEISTIGKSVISELKANGKVETYSMRPDDFGVKTGNVNEIMAAGSHKENAKITIRILSGEDKSSRRDLVLLNAGAILYLADCVKDIKDGYEIACKVVDSGKALKKVEELVRIGKGSLETFYSLI